ncbi:MAG: DUF4147 domain-containing protein [Gemmatimonas sp.]|nr:DUF4147 domain-containing protein [Gemmatimonas sp.]
MTARSALQRAFRAALDAAGAEGAVRRFCQLDGERLELGSGESLTLSEFERIWLVGAGKATPPMARAMVDLLGTRVVGGVVTTKDRHGVALPLDLWEARHPVPDVRGMAAAAETLRLARSAAPSDLLICLLSGGASALWAAPDQGLSLGDLQRVTDGLLRAAAPIDELNAVRKHLSRIAGGRLARASGAGRMLTLAVSDVLGDKPDVIGSGPTVPDPTTFADALSVLECHDLEVPPSVVRHLQAGLSGGRSETPGPEDPLWERTSYVVVASLSDALSAAADALTASGFESRILSTGLTGEARAAGATIARQALAVKGDGPKHPIALLWGGETTVTVRGEGRGGRNQEMALAAALELEGSAGVLIGCFATDGTDGPTDAAGGYADGGSVVRARAGGVDPHWALDQNDSYAFLTAAGDLVCTGPTGTNVNDVAIALCF